MTIPPLPQSVRAVDSGTSRNEKRNFTHPLHSSPPPPALIQHKKALLSAITSGFFPRPPDLNMQSFGTVLATGMADAMSNLTGIVGQ